MVASPPLWPGAREMAETRKHPGVSQNNIQSAWLSPENCFKVLSFMRRQVRFQRNGNSSWKCAGSMRNPPIFPLDVRVVNRILSSCANNTSTSTRALLINKSCYPPIDDLLSWSLVSCVGEVNELSCFKFNWLGNISIFIHGYNHVFPMASLMGFLHQAWLVLCRNQYSGTAGWYRTDHTRDAAGKHDMEERYF